MSFSAGCAQYLLFDESDKQFVDYFFSFAFIICRSNKNNKQFDVTHTRWWCSLRLVICSGSLVHKCFALHHVCSLIANHDPRYVHSAHHSPQLLTFIFQAAAYPLTGGDNTATRIQCDCCRAPTQKIIKI